MQFCWTRAASNRFSSGLDKLRHAHELLVAGGLADRAQHEQDLAAVADLADEIVAAARAAMDWARQPWPDVVRDDRGLGREIRTAV